MWARFCFDEKLPYYSLLNVHLPEDTTSQTMEHTIKNMEEVILSVKNT